MWMRLVIKLIAACEVVFGVGGLIGLLAELASSSGPPWVIDTGGDILLFGLSVGAGLWLWLRSGRGALPSVAVQALQAITLGYHGFAFRFVVGPHCTIPIASPPLWSPYGVQGIVYRFSQPTFPEQWAGVNVVAAAATVFLAIVWYRARREGRLPGDAMHPRGGGHS